MIINILNQISESIILFCVSHHLIFILINFYIESKSTEKIQKIKIDQENSDINREIIKLIENLIIKFCQHPFANENSLNNKVGIDKIPDLDRKMLFEIKFFDDFIQYSTRSEISEYFVKNVLANDKMQLRNLIKKVFGYIQTAEDTETIKKNFSILNTILQTQDDIFEWKFEFVMNKITENLQTEKKTNETTIEYFRNLFEMCQKNKSVLLWMFKHKEDWVFVSLIKQELFESRKIAYDLVSLFLNLSHDDSQEPHSIFSEIFDFLIGLIPLIIADNKIAFYSNKSRSKQEIINENEYKLCYYFDIFLDCLEKDILLKEKLESNFEKLWELFIEIEECKKNADSNKLHFFNLFYSGTKTIPNLVDFIAKDQTRTDSFLKIHLSLNSTKPELIGFNYNFLFPFYSILYQCCLNSNEFMTEFFDRFQFEWTIKSLYLNSNIYGKVHEVVFNIIKSTKSFPSFKKKILQIVTQNWNNSNQDTCSKSLNLLEIIFAEPDEEIYQQIINQKRFTIKKNTYIPLCKNLSKFIIPFLKNPLFNSFGFETISRSVHLMISISQLIIQFSQDNESAKKLQTKIHIFWEEKYIELMKKILHFHHRHPKETNHQNFFISLINLLELILQIDSSKTSLVLQKEIQFLKRDLNSKGLVYFIGYYDFIKSLINIGLKQTKEKPKIFEIIDLILQISTKDIQLIGNHSDILQICINPFINSQIIKEEEDIEKIIQISKNYQKILFENTNLIEMENVKQFMNSILSLISNSKSESKMDHFRNLITSIKIEVKISIKNKDEKQINNLLQILAIFFEINKKEMENKNEFENKIKGIIDLIKENEFDYLSKLKLFEN
ncbi:hypothetical protein M0811_01126 [Anaeramoeba ignava]|uniref:Uncharacterized protein n=1 Tax=Anaeramoeba ignava TaxID=1746090 RepID=A0A9Q0LNR3_ANAIG|nr:hypothetical protein M0811_01126 [Anaeramoeba ignava]